MSLDASLGASLGERIIDRIEEILQAAEEETRPVELEPARSRLFELFVMANGAGLTNPSGEGSLSADNLCKQLADRWGLGEAARSWVDRNQRLSSTQMAKMRLLWSLMRMWMEWDYAWSRWNEFHGGTT